MGTKIALNLKSTGGWPKRPNHGWFGGGGEGSNANHDEDLYLPIEKSAELIARHLVKDHERPGRGKCSRVYVSLQ
jgi:hypothetical protein